MNGLLHRLAARASGTVVLVRSDARLPYGRGSLDWADAGEGPAAPAPAAAPRSHSASAPESHDLPAAVPPTGSTVLARPVVELPRWVEPTPLLSGAVAPAVDGAATADTPPSTRANVVATPTSRAQDAGQPASAAGTALIGQLATHATNKTPSAQDAGIVPSRAPTNASTNDPTPLMPRVASQPATPPMPTASSPRDARLQAAAQAPGDDSTEVHIHIGRIDVTAVHDAPPAPRRRAAAPAPMSLDGYLAGRRRSGA